MTQETGVEYEPPVTDPVTGAYPRALLQPRLDEELARAARNGGSCAVFLFDVDFFKTINDAYGHLRGDEALRQLAGRVKSTVRTGDALFRYGGDEFVLVLPETDRAEAVGLALRLTEEVRAHEFSGQPPLHMSVSLGVATYPDDGDDLDSLVACADRRNYLAKRRGRGGAVADDADTDAPVLSSRLWERDVPMAGVQDFLTRVLAEHRGALRVTGEPGAGYTRFLSEVAVAARLRGFTVVTAPPDGEPGADQDLPEGVQVLIVGDLDAGQNAADIARRLLSAAEPPESLGLVHASAEPVPTGLPLLASVELTPWSPAALRVWLRQTLQGEPTRTLVSWLAGHSGGLPARAVSELDRLRRRDGLVATPSGGWTVSPAMLGRLRRRGRLPVPMTKLVGRQRERTRVARLLADGRLVTLVGTGGVGKTRLSLAVAGDVAETYDDGAVFVPLADTTSADQVVAGLARALEVAEVPGQPLFDSVTEYLAGAHLLLVLDNFEQVIDAAGVVSDLLAAAPGVSALVTSRERLSLYGEQVYPVPPLPLPDPDRSLSVEQALVDWPVLALFDHRARAAAGDFALTPETLPVVAALCRRLDGLPLAIELAAARSDRLTPEELLIDLVHHLDALGDGPRDLPARQQTLRGAIGWSVALLDADDQRLFTRLAVFAGGWTVDAAAAVIDESEHPDQVAARLAALADKSLLVAESDTGGVVRYRMLETIRAYADAELAGDPAAEQVRARHAAYYAELAEQSAVALTGPEQATWAALLDREYQNLGVAFATGDHDIAARLCLGLWRYWQTGKRIGEGRAWLDHVLASAEELPDAVAAQLLYAAAALAIGQRDHERTYLLAADGLRRADAAAERPLIAQALNALGLAVLNSGRYVQATDHLRRSLEIWRELDHAPGMAIALGNLTTATLRLGDIDTASDYARQCLEIERAAGNTRGIALCLERLGEILLVLGDEPGAQAALAESLQLSRALGDLLGEAMVLHQLGDVAKAGGDPDEALRLFFGALTRRHEVGDLEDLAESLDSVAAVLAGRAPTLAVQLLGAACGARQRQRHRLADPAVGDHTVTGGMLRVKLGDEEFEAAWNAGLTTPVGLLVDQALDLVPSPA